jgi:hypothetical protein
MQQFVVQHPGLFAVCNLLFVLGVISGVGFVISMVGGWHSLAEHFRTEREFPAHKRWMQSASMRMLTGYNNALTLGSDSEGIYLGMTLPILLRHPRLFVPWTEVRVDQPRQFLWRTVRTLSLGPDAIPLTVRERTAQFLLESRAGTSDASGAISSTF